MSISPTMPLDRRAMTGSDHGDDKRNERSEPTTDRALTATTSGITERFICAEPPTRDHLAERRISERCRWVIGHAEHPLGELIPRRPFGASTFYRWVVPVQDVSARDIAAGDVVRLDD